MQFGAVCTTLMLLGLGSAAQDQQHEQRPDALSIIRASLERNKSNESRLKDYTYTESQETRTLGKSGAVIKTEGSTSEVLNLYGRPYKRRISKDGRALVGKDKEKADQDFEREVHKRQQETEEQGRKLEEERDKERAEGRKFLQEIPRAYSFSIVAEETMDARAVWVLDAQPRPDFRSSVKRADLLKKMHGRLWIDKQSLQWVRAEVELIEPVSFGGFLAKLDRGARLTFVQKRVNDEVWLPEKMTARVEARLLVKHYSLATETRWSNYRKFRVDSRMVAVDEAGPSRP